MHLQAATEEYLQALRQGQKEYRELVMAQQRAHPAVLDELLPAGCDYPVVELGQMEIPLERVLGVKSAGRVTAFTAGFLPLLEGKSEFANKWIHLCAAHLGDAGITDPIECYEYLGDFYVQEGNKRVSVLRHFGAARISSKVRRILPPLTDEPRVRAYYEFLEFYKASRLYGVQFRRPGDYARLLARLGKPQAEAWTEEERRTFRAYFHYFQEAFREMHATGRDILPEEALLQWLELYPWQDLGRLSSAQLRRSLAGLWEDVLTANDDSVQLRTRAEDAPGGIVSRLVSNWDRLNVAFVHQLTPETSHWVLNHEEGRAHIEAVFGEKIAVRSYFGANTPEECRAAIARAVEEGAQVVFTTSPLMRRATLRAAVDNPRVRFLNCSVDQPYTSFRSYYGRIYEAKFITGAIAGALSGDDRIGYITAYPIFGVPASINAFALGAQMTNPRAQIELRWTCLPGDPQAELYDEGIRVISNRSAPAQAGGYLDFCSYGTYLMDGRGEPVPLATPVWVWGKFYEFVLRSIFSGGWKREKGVSAALNYWLGMDSGVIGLKLSHRLPEGVRTLARLLQRDMEEGRLDPFLRRITAQDGTVKNDGTHAFTPEALLRMDWLCDNVVGRIPAFQELLPMSRELVRELGIHRDTTPKEKEGRPPEDFDHLR